jgi:hypothetical protein
VRLHNAVIALLYAVRLWLETNKSSIGEKWYRKVVNDLKRIEDVMKDDLNRLDVHVLSTALWLFNITVALGVLAHMGPQGLRVVKVPEHLDRATTLLLLVSIYDAFKSAEECAQS